MISSIICVIKMASISWGEFVRVALPILIAEFILDEILINVISDKLSKKTRDE